MAKFREIGPLLLTRAAVRGSINEPTGLLLEMPKLSPASYGNSTEGAYSFFLVSEIYSTYPANSSRFERFTVSTAGVSNRSTVLVLTLGSPSWSSGAGTFYIVIAENLGSASPLFSAEFWKVIGFAPRTAVFHWIGYLERLKKLLTCIGDCCSYWSPFYTCGIYWIWCFWPNCGPWADRKVNLPLTSD